MGICRLLILLLFFPSIVYAQYFSTGVDPGSLKWRQIITHNFQLIYPEEFESNAQKMARYFEKVYDYGSATLQHKPAKISVIIHTRTVNSNGLVALAPRRMELYTPPHQDIYGQDWLEQLVLHEFRHVVQVDKINSQLPLILKALLGEQALALATGLYLPFWFLEGDAVISETALSTKGRGRFPSFLMEHKAQVIEKGVFSFSKAYNGSYKDFVPDHYKLGYLLVGETRARYGNNIVWENIVNQLSRRPLSITPTEKMLKLHTGMTQKKLYHSIFDSLRTEWVKEDQLYIPSKCSLLTKIPENFSNYRFNHILPSGEIVSYKTGFDGIPCFVMTGSSGKEKVITVPGEIFQESVGYRNHQMVWSENVPDLRWTHSGKSVIRMYNTDSKKATSFHPEYKCFAPAISFDEHNVAVVEVDFQNNYYLSVYNAVTGELVKRYQTPDNNYIFDPVWKNEKELFVILLTEEGKRLAVINPYEGSLGWLTREKDLGDIKHLVYMNDRIYFISSYSGRNELYTYHLESHDISRVVRARFGIESPAFSADGNRLILSDYTACGFRLIEMKISDLEAIPIEKVTKGNYRLAEVVSEQEPGMVKFSESDQISYVSKPYSKILNLFNFHSWAPFSMEVESMDLKPGVSIASQNKLSTNVTSVGCKCNTANNTGNFYAGMEYSGWFPVLKVEASRGREASIYNEIRIYQNPSGEEVGRDTLQKRYQWEQTEMTLSSRLPLNLTRGKYYSLLQPEIRYGYTGYGHTSSTPAGFIRGNVHTLAWRIYFHRILRQSARDVQPDWGWISDINYRHSPSANRDIGHLASLRLQNYWPGFLKNHGVTTSVGVQQRGQGPYFGDVLRMPRGWPTYNSNRMISSCVEYKMPLLYPDLELGRFIYLRRIKTALFFDHAWLEENLNNNGKNNGTIQRKMTSAGVDITVDSNLLRFYAPVNIGFRTAYLPEITDVHVEFIFSVDFRSF